MTKKTIVREIAAEVGVSQLVVQAVVEALFERLAETVLENKRVELRRFGVFEIRRRAARTARNPNTGEAVKVGARNVLVFKPGRVLTMRVRQLVLPGDEVGPQRSGRSPRKARGGTPRARSAGGPAGEADGGTE